MPSIEYGNGNLLGNIMGGITRNLTYCLVCLSIKQQMLPVLLITPLEQCHWVEPGPYNGAQGNSRASCQLRYLALKGPKFCTVTRWRERLIYLGDPGVVFALWLLPLRTKHLLRMEPRPRSSASSTEHIVVDVHPPESEPPPEALLEIGNLIRIQGLRDDHITRLQVALQDWERSLEEYKKHVDTYKKDRDVLRNEIYQGVGFFSAFQGLLLTAVAQSTLLSCKNLIFPFLLSAIATFTTVALVLQKYSVINNLESRISVEEPAQQVRRHRIRCLCSYRK
ncbi:unnamed protein product [Sphagnum balticum]